MVIVLLASSTIALYVVLSSEAKHPVMVSPVTFSLPAPCQIVRVLAAHEG